MYNELCIILIAKSYIVPGVQFKQTKIKLKNKNKTKKRKKKREIYRPYYSPEKQFKSINTFPTSYYLILTLIKRKKKAVSF